MSKWQERLSELQAGNVKDLLSTCLHVILNPSSHRTYFQLGSLANTQEKRSSKLLIQLSLRLALVVKYVTWLIPMYIRTSFQMLHYKVILKRRGDGPLIKAETILLLVWEALLQVKALICSLLTTRTQNKKPQ